jgi:isopentenyl-diphosphate delta-isomerase type 1
MELIDVIDEDGNPTGTVKPRKSVHRDGDLHRTVHVWLLTSRKEVLLQKRAKTKSTHPGLWDMACAGHITHGETSLEASVKEIEEELGIQINPEDIRFLFSIKSRHIHHGGVKTDYELHDVYLVKKDIPLSFFTLQIDEVEAVKYIPIADFRKKVFNRDSDLVPHFEEFEKICAILGVPV